MDHNTSINSIDKLMEFGLSMAVANQMIQTMNAGIRQMSIPGAGSNYITNKRIEEYIYYFVIDKKQAGPFSIKEISELIKKGILNDRTLTWKNGMEGWTPAYNIPEINKHLIMNK